MRKTEFPGSEHSLGDAVEDFLFDVKRSVLNDFAKPENQGKGFGELCRTKLEGMRMHSLDGEPVGENELVENALKRLSISD